jgi:hypothetical protein
VFVVRADLGGAALQVCRAWPRCGSAPCLVGSRLSLPAALRASSCLALLWLTASDDCDSLAWATSRRCARLVRLPAQPALRLTAAAFDPCPQNACSAYEKAISMESDHLFEVRLCTKPTMIGASLICPASARCVVLNWVTVGALLPVAIALVLVATLRVLRTKAQCRLVLIHSFMQPLSERGSPALVFALTAELCHHAVQPRRPGAGQEPLPGPQSAPPSSAFASAQHVPFCGVAVCSVACVGGACPEPRCLLCLLECISLAELA